MSHGGGKNTKPSKFTLHLPDRSYARQRPDSLQPLFGRSRPLRTAPCSIDSKVLGL